jgi:hypothetical protein
MPSLDSQIKGGTLKQNLNLKPTQQLFYSNKSLNKNKGKP